ncbi:MAG: hypothetical protein AAGK79_13370 [Pseudomonadota bacterium]
MTDLDAIKADWRRTSFVWGHSDCILSVCDYVLRVSGRDPAAPWRGTYHDEAGAEDLCQTYGGVLGIFRHGMQKAGFDTCARAPGCPVVIDFFGREMAGIDLGKRVMLRMEGRGIVEWPAEPKEAWSICG